MVAEAVAAGCQLQGQFVGPGVNPVEGAGPVHHLGRGVAERVSDTQTSTGLLAIIDIPHAAGDVLANAELVVIADQIADPGNLGTILRSAEAAGFDVVVITPGTVDPYNPKTVRASAGSVLHVPVVVAELAEARAAGLRLLGTSSHRGTAHTNVDWHGRLAIVAGSEAHGVQPTAAVDEWVRIEHHGRGESINVAMAVTVLCFEAARARP